jgi:glutamine cyclotransferase
MSDGTSTIYQVVDDEASNAFSIVKRINVTTKQLMPVWSLNELEFVEDSKGEKWIYANTF